MCKKEPGADRKNIAEIQAVDKHSVPRAAGHPPTASGLLVQYQSILKLSINQ